MITKICYPLLSLCLCLFFTTTTTAQRSSSKMVTEEFQLETFHSIGLAIPANVTITQGDQQKVVVTASQDVLDLITKDIEDHSWEIGFKKKVRGYGKIDIAITIKSLEEIGIAGSGNVKTVGAFSGADNFELSIAGSGNANIAINTKAIECSISGSGNAKFNGQTETLDISKIGSGNINAYDLKAQNCTVNGTGSGNCRISASGKIDASLVGSGNVYYKGAPKIDASVIGSGNVKKAD